MLFVRAAAITLAPMDPTPTDASLPQQLQEYYQLHFAGRPRLTRNPVVLSQLIALAKRDGAPALVQAWGEERAAIEAEQAQAGLAGRQVAHAIEEAQIVLNRLALLQLGGSCFHEAAVDHHALSEALQDGQDMEALLQPLVALPSSQQQLAQATLDQVAAACAQATRLLAQTQEQRTTGPAMARARACVRAAQLLQHSFDTRVAGQQGHLLRAERITALAQGLQDVAGQLRACGLEGPEHEANCQGLLSQASAWRAQAQKAAAQRRQHTLDEIAHGLGGAADEILAAAYAWDTGNDGSVEALLQGLSLFDRMDEARRQLVGVPLIYGHTEHQHTLSTVTDGLAYVTARVEHAAGARAPQ